MNKPSKNQAQDNLCHNCPKFGNCPLQNSINEKPHQCLRALQAYMQAQQKRTLESLRRAAELNQEAAAINARTLERLKRLNEDMEKTDKERIEAHYHEKDLTRATATIYFKDPGPGWKWLSGGVVRLMKQEQVAETVCKRKSLPRIAMVPLKRKTRVIFDYDVKMQMRSFRSN